MAETGDTHRIVSQDREDGGRDIAVVRRSEENDRLTDEEIIAELNEWKASRRHLHAVDDE